MPDWDNHVRPRLSSLRLPAAREHEIVMELSQHLDDRWRELVAGGTPEDEATRLALAEFRDGNLLAAHLQPLRQAQMPAPITPGAPRRQLLRDLWGDARYALRLLRRQPAFSLTAVLTLALGIGATTAMFSVVHGVVLEPLPYPDSENVVTLGVSAVFGTERTADFPLAPRLFMPHVESSRSFQALGLFATSEATVTGLGSPERASVMRLTRGVLTALGVPPIAGRWFTPEDDRPGARQTVILSYAYWQRRFGGDPSIIGRTMTVASAVTEVIGIMPPSFSVRDLPVDLILPFQFDPDQPPPGFCCRGVARLASGATLAEANAEVAGMLDVWKRLENRQALDDLQLGPAVRPLKNDVVGDVGAALWVLLGGISLLLVIACANIANLLLVRAQGRGQELAVRTALGAGWWHVARLMMVESLALGLLGGLVGLGLAWGGLRALLAIAPANLPRLNDITIDAAVLGFAVVTSLLSGLIFGLVPIAKIVRWRSAPGLVESIRGGGRAASADRSHHRSQDALVVVQVAMALVLLIGSGLMLRTFQNLRSVHPGFTDPATIQAVRLTVPAVDIPDPDRVTRVQQDILGTLAAIPGVRSAALVDTLPMESASQQAIVAAEGKEYGARGIPPTRTIKMISSGALRTLGIPLVAGRDFTPEEIVNQRNVALVSESFARGEWSTVEGALGTLAAIPGVRSAALVDTLPMESASQQAIVAAEGKEYGARGIPPTRTIKMISSGALRTLGIPLVAGRDFTPEEIVNQRNVALVSESFARGEWSTVEDALGKRVLVGTSQTWQEVIGVVADVYDNGPGEPAPPTVYWPARLQDYVAGTLLPRSVNFVMRTARAGTDALARDVRQAVADVMPGLPVFQVRTLREVHDASMASTSFALVLLAIAGAVALMLGIVGIYGALAYAVMQRQREVGIRLALGARPGIVQGLFVSWGMRLAGLGIVAGTAAAAGVTRWMSSLLFGVAPIDAATFAAAAGVLGVAALAACYIPARRAAALDPVRTLTPQ